MSEVVGPVAAQLGLGGVGGFFVGYALKKLAKIIAILLGLGIVVLLYLSQTGYIQVNYDKLSEATSRLLGAAGQAQAWLTPLLANLPFAGSFLLGFALGFKKG